jgi:hypothetical protein
MAELGGNQAAKLLAVKGLINVSYHIRQVFFKMCVNRSVLFKLSHLWNPFSILSKSVKMA